MIRVTVPWDPDNASRNRLDGRHWTVKRHAYAKGQETAAWAWIAAGRPRAPGAVLVTLLIRRAEWMDLDGALSGCKPVIDGLFRKAITPNDSPVWIRSVTVLQERRAGRSEVEVLVENAA